MTSSYRQNRTRLFLPIKGNKDISKTLSRDGYLTMLNLPIGYSLNEKSLSLKSKSLNSEIGINFLGEILPPTLQILAHYL